MRVLVVWLLLAVAVAELVEEPWVEEEDVDEPYNDEDEEVFYRQRRDVYEDPYEEHIRVKRCCEEPRRVRRSEDYVRKPRQVHQYEVHEFMEEHEPSSPPYEEMLAAASDHYHKVYASPGAPRTTRYLDPDVSSTVNVVSQHPTKHQTSQSPTQTNNAAPHAYQIQQPLYQAAYANSVPSPLADRAPQTFNAAPQPSKQGNRPVDNVFEPSQVTRFSKLPSLVSSQGSQAYQPAETAYKPAQPAPFSQHPSHAHVSSPVYVARVPVEVPAPAVAPVLTLQNLDGDQAPAAAGLLPHKHSHGHKQGGGHGHLAKHHGQHGGKATKGFNQDHYVDKGGKGHKTDEHHRKEYEEAAGKKKKHHDTAGHKGSHEEQAHGHRGAQFDEKKGHKKGHKTKGYHNKYHKDEFHKEHKFYDDYHKSGEHHRFGKFNAKHASNESGKKKAHHVNAGHDYVERGKKGYSNKGHVDADHKGYEGKNGHEEHHQKESSHGKKGGKEGGSHWGYAKKN